MHELNHYSSWKIKILRWHHENVVVACLSADEVHTPPSDPQDKLHLLKIIKTEKENIKKHSENHQKI